jgi:tetratricopeptide (TPR) repeat protein
MRRNVLGTAYLGQLKWTDAEAAFRDALKLRGDDPGLLTNAAIALNQQGRIDEAVELLEKALESDPDFAHARYNLGLIASREGNYEPAAEHFSAVARLDPEDLFTQYYLGTTLGRIGREDEAIAAYRAALARDPTHVSSLYGLGRLLLQAGDEQEGMELINRSQEIRSRSGLDVAVGGEYGEQGPYSIGYDYPGDAVAAPDPVPVTFELAYRVEVERAPTGLPHAVTRLEGLDVPVFLISQRGTVLQLSPPGRSNPVAPIAPEGRTIVALAAGDVDNDRRVDLAALLASADGTLAPAVWIAGEDATFSDADLAAFGGESAVNLGGLPTGADLAFVDRDHDGDLDLFACWTAADASRSGCALATNDGEGSYDVQPSSAHGFEAGVTSGPVYVAFSDVDNDRDVDLLVAGATGVQLLTNQRDGSFDDISDRAGLGSAAATSGRPAIADLNKDGWMDLVIGTESGARWLRNHRGRLKPAADLASGAAAATGAIAVLDVDNDGFLDVAQSSAAGTTVHHNRGAGKWDLRGDLTLAGPDASVLSSFDADADGDLDLLAFDSGLGASRWTNEGGNANRWIVLESKGAGDNRFGIGTKVEALAGALRQKFEITTPLALHVGLGSREGIQSARYLWPGGVLQDEIELAAGAPSEIQQVDRKGTSCPLLYAWNDGRWQFVTDFLGGSAVGYQLAPGVFSTPDTDEYVKIVDGLTPDEDGRLRLRLNNQLEEVIWFDEAHLVAVDHPEGTEVYPNERLMPGPPFPEFELFASNDVRPVLAARDVEHDADVTSLLREADRRFVDSFELLPPKGYAEMHTLELDLGAIADDRRIVLLLDGWIDYADSSANVAAVQAGLSLVPPRLLVADGRGGWIERDGVMGFPAGLPKTMAVELTGLFPTGERRLRIATNMRIYWDRARVMVGGEDTPLEVTRLHAETAELRYGGFPRETSPDGKKPHAYDPYSVDEYRWWKAHVGAYTSYGDVRELVSAIDDRFVTTRNGDEMELRFPGRPATAPGHTRTYLLFADGFGKDMDPNSAAAEHVAPIPFHGMPTYPYGDGVTRPTTGDEPPEHRYVHPSDRGWPGTRALALAGEAR